MSQATALSPVLENIRTHLENRLAPDVQSIDTDGIYPGDYLRELGEMGGFRAAIDSQKTRAGDGLARQIDIISTVAQTCGSTAFLVWCQSVCAWYLQNSPNEATRQTYLEPVASGRLLAGTGMSNTVKHLAGIEKIHLRASSHGSHYEVNGALPWVSNIGTEHIAIVAAAVEDGGYILFLVAGDTPGIELHRCPEFAGLNGTRTLGMHFRRVSIPAESVLAGPEDFPDYIRQIKPGFILTQAGMGLGITESALTTIRKANRKTAHVNHYLDEQEPSLTAQLNRLHEQASQLAHQARQDTASLVDILKLRLHTSELTLAATQSAALHAGARGYLMSHPVQRLQREALFVAIVTPALKHLRKEIHDLEQASPNPAKNARPARARARQSLPLSSLH